GTLEQLREFAGRVLARRLDRSRPLWEMYLVEGLEDDRFALVGKSHLCLVDGIDAVDLGQVLLDTSPAPAVEVGTAEPWRPLPEPPGLELVVGALWESARDPHRAVDNARGVVTEALGTAIAVGEAVGGVGALLSQLAGDALRGGRPPADSPVAGEVSEQRRLATVRLPLADLKAAREENRHTVNDVVLAVITGALRAWLLTRGESITSSSTLTALVPMSVTEDEALPTSLGSRVAPHLQTLPIGEPNALMRLHHVAYGTQAHKDSGRAVDARALSDLAGFAPSTLHALGVRVAAEVMRRPHDLVITNVPGPQLPLYAAGARLTDSYPVLPLAPGHLMAIGVTSYDGEVFVGLTADRDAVRDLDVLAACLHDALEELLDAGGRGRQPTRAASPAAKRAAARKAAARQEAAARTGQRRAAVRRIASGANSLGAARLRAARGAGKPAERPARGSTR
ncbi:MAG: wax ester/triacylglycerol synthase family O-acyltransferase, partial [Actinomycetes bacterium]